MTGKTDRVVLIKGNGTKWYEQAIFIVNPHFKQDIPLDIVAEAERIVRDYGLDKALIATPQITPTITPPPQTKKAKGKIISGLLMAIACTVLAGIFAFGLFS